MITFSTILVKLFLICKHFLVKYLVSVRYTFISCANKDVLTSSLSVCVLLLSSLFYCFPQAFQALCEIEVDKVGLESWTTAALAYSLIGPTFDSQHLHRGPQSSTTAVSISLLIVYLFKLFIS